MTHLMRLFDFVDICTGIPGSALGMFNSLDDTLAQMAVSRGAGAREVADFTRDRGSNSQAFCMRRICRADRPLGGQARIVEGIDILSKVAKEICK